jgi:hypothetical protein
MLRLSRDEARTVAVTVALACGLAACGSAAGATQSASSAPSTAAWQAIAAPTDPTKVILAENLMPAEDPAEWGGKQGDVVFLAQTTAAASPVDLTAARWKAFIDAFGANVPAGTTLLGVSVGTDAASLTEGRPSFRFLSDPAFSPISEQELSTAITNTASKLGLKIDSIATSDSDAGPVAIVTATAPGGDVATFAQDHPGIAAELAGGPTGNVFVQVLDDNGYVGYVDAGVGKADAEFHWFDPGLPGCHYLVCPQPSATQTGQ